MIYISLARYAYFKSSGKGLISFRRRTLLNYQVGYAIATKVFVVIILVLKASFSS
jgi:hypothetical protein